MNLYCDKQALIDAVGNVGHAAMTKSALPALEGILLKATGTSLFLAGYDLDMGITTTIEADVRDAGEIVLSAKLLGDIVRRLPEDRVFIGADEKLVTKIRSGKTEFTIMGIAAIEYPEIPAVSDGVGFTVPQKTMKSMIRQTIFAVAQNDNRPVHTGVQFEIEEGTMRLVSVDGSRLAMRSEVIQSEEQMRFVVPGKTLNEVLKLLSDEETPMSLAVGHRHIVLEIDGYAVISRLLDGEFLPYRKAIPQQSSTTIKTKTRDLINAVERASIVINDRIKSPLICEFRDGQVTVSCNTPIGSVYDIINIDIEGNEEEMGFNSRFLLEALKNTETDEVRIELSGALSPMKILPSSGDSFLFLVLPVRLKK
ncbi:MAG: DNA polymerase III subunit beta [Oscillospiraceae bacterium]|nr:DNA polymerase III subunit beta [Oscillospiraceae bacterium]MDD3832726.1 DNA polymerase III subunit beta [Oscillospiraceae bacterium]MDD4546218.1 DNA polymerase III subunit beta [Oscillospiraceae bacterium]